MDSGAMCQLAYCVRCLIRYQITLGNDIVVIDTLPGKWGCSITMPSLYITRHMWRICMWNACGMHVCQAMQAMDATCNAITIE
eukprot:scaffold40115_cov58-Attheya_sp.AAC.2